MGSRRWLDQYNGSDQLQRPAGTASHYAHCPRKDSQIKNQTRTTKQKYIAASYRCSSKYERKHVAISSFKLLNGDEDL